MMIDNTEKSKVVEVFVEIKCNENTIKEMPFVNTAFLKLIEELKKLEEKFGSKSVAFDIEWKVRFFVVMVLMHAFREQPLRIDGEIPIYLFQKKVSPDL